MKQGREVWFCDETSTHMWQKKSRIWRNPDEPYHLTLNKQRGASITIIGVISSMRPRFFFMIAPTTTKESVDTFLKKTFKKLDVRDNVIVMDQHAAHNSDLVKARLAKLGLERHYLPAASCCLNPIEHVWGIFKAKWATYLLENKDLVTPANAEWHITQLLNNINFGNCSHRVFEPMWTVLNGSQV